MNEIIFTRSALAELLMSIEELKDKPIEIGDTENGMEIHIGDYTYNVEAEVEVEAPEGTVAEIVQINEDGYESLQESLEAEEPIESGIITNMIKSLLLGGAIRLSSKLLKEQELEKKKK